MSKSLNSKKEKKYKVLELFCGTGSVSKICQELGWEVYSVDISDKYYPLDLKVDILKWDYKSLDFKPDIIWASPPCSSFSKMLYMSKTKEEIKKGELKVGVPLLNKTREIIDYFNPKYYFIENPDSSRMKNYIKDLSFYRVCYCMYGYDYQKATRIWTNIKDFNAKYCNHKGRHKVAITTSIQLKNRKQKTVNSLNNRYSIPPQLIRDLFYCLQKNIADHLSPINSLVECFSNDPLKQ